MSPAARNRAQIVALLPEIDQALTDGCSLAMIWNTLHEEGTLACGYETFRSHVRSLMQQPSEGRPAPRPATQGASTAKKPLTPTPAGSQGSGFTFNPVPNEEDLY